MPTSGEIYTCEIYYKGTNGQCKTRPILVLNDLGNGEITIAEITSVESSNPPKYFDRYKEEIKGWKQCGLDKPSYVKCKNVHNVRDLRLISRLGSLEPNEFSNIVNKITMYI